MKRHRLRGFAATAVLAAVILAFVSPSALAQALSTDTSSFAVDIRERAPLPDTPGQSRVVCKRAVWQPQETAIIICDMWNQHWCQGATRRVGQVAPPMNEVVSIARDRGVLIVHAPSGTIDHYANHPARRLAQNTPHV